MKTYYTPILIIIIVIIITYLAIVIYNTKSHPKRQQTEKFEDTDDDTMPNITNETDSKEQHQALTREYKIRFVEPRTCYAKIEGKERYRMQSYNQLFEYWFPGLKCHLVPETEPADIAIIGNGCSDNTALRPNEVNIFISIENVPHWNQYPHYSKYGDYNDPLIDIFIYNHKSTIEYLADQADKHKIMIPTILFRMNYFITNYDNLKIPQSISKPPQDRKFCLMVNKSGLNSKAGQFQEKINAIAPTDHISLYDQEIGESSCYNPPELLKIFNQYRFIICFENSYNPGYITEKIFNCLLADTIPIYSGSPIIHDFINPDCFINIGENDDLDQATAKISEINTVPDKYSQYLTAQKISKKYLDTGINTEFKNKYYDVILAKQQQQE